MTTIYVTNVRTVVRVNGQVVVVPPSTRLPDGVAQSEIDRLLRFGVIRVEEISPEPASAAATVELAEPEAAPARVSGSAARARKKSEPIEE
ncbi:hypothetical protein [Microbacterium sp. KNMS]